jgi:hypothetical protein
MYARAGRSWVAALVRLKAVMRFDGERMALRSVGMKGDISLSSSLVG